MKLELIITFLIFANVSLSQNDSIVIEQINNADVTLSEIDSMTIYKLEPDGYWYLRCSNGEIKAKGEMEKKFHLFSMKRSFVKEGVWTYYNCQGRVIKEEEYKKGKLVSVN